MGDNEEILDILQNIEELLTVLVKNQISDTIEKELSNPKKKELYKLTGKNKISELAKKLKCSTGWISGVWKHWESLGLIIKDGQKYRKVL